MGLMLHAGAAKVTLDELLLVPTPAATETWQPIPHRTLIDMVEKNLVEQGYEIKKADHAIAKDGNRYFGLMELKKDNGYQDYTMVAGLRNSHDMSFPAGLILGSQVFVCDNLAFSAEVSFARKHTRWIMNDLPQIVNRALGKLGDLGKRQDNRITAYKGRDVGDMEMHDFVIRSLEAKVIPAQYINGVLEQYRTPNHVEFKPRNAWSLFNAYTETLKGTSQDLFAKRTQALHGMMDSFCGIAGDRTMKEVEVEEAYAGA